MQYSRMTKVQLIEENRRLRQQLSEINQEQPKLNNVEPRPVPQKFLKSQSVFRQLTENIPVLIYVFHGDRFIYVNRAFELGLGYPMEELLEMNFWDVVHPDYKELIKQRGLARQRGENEPNRYELKVFRKNGDEMWLDLFTSSAIDINGETIIVVGCYDISERKSAREELKKARDELEIRVIERTEALSEANQELVFLNSTLNSVIKNMSDAVVLVDKRGSVQSLNKVLELAWGKAVKEIIQYLKEDILGPKISHSAKMLENGAAFRDKEIMFSTQKGDIQSLVSGTPIRNEQGEVEWGILLVRPLKDVRKLVNRFSGAQASFRFEDIIGSSEGIKETIRAAMRAAYNLSSILIEGESGTGKEMFAQSVHNMSYRRNEPFVALNCGAIPRDLIASELFGYAEGAFTGAKKGGSPGKFEMASGGTLFLDEIGDMPFEQQVALLRVIQEKHLTRIGGDKLIPVDVRIICATNKNLFEEMQKGKFRKDLYYRINVISLKIPPLRQRPEDVSTLFKYLLMKAGKKEILKYLDPKVIESLEQYDWPGNVRELQNVVERMLNAADGANIGIEHLPEELCPIQSGCVPTAESSARWLENLGAMPGKARKIAAEIERQEILETIERCNGNVSKVARELGISRSTMYRKMSCYGIKQ